MADTITTWRQPIQLSSPQHGLAACDIGACERAELPRPDGAAYRAAASRSSSMQRIFLLPPAIPASRPSIRCGQVAPLHDCIFVGGLRAGKLRKVQDESAINNSA